MTIRRRDLFLGAAATTAAAAFGLGPALTLMAARADPAGFGEAVPFSRAALLAAAEALAGEAFDDRRDQVPEPLRALSYNAYRAIRPGPGFPAPLSEDGGFLYETMPAGFVFAQPVDIHVVEGDMARPLLAFRERHIFDPPASDVIPEDLLEVPFSGFRLRSPINAGDVFDEFAVFQGASYFRAVGAGETYGLSARGLAIDTAQSGGEEFPYFRSFWIEAPSPGASAVVVHALLDSPSTTGLYRITMRPGQATLTDVELTLFPRRDIATIGFAPFSSMFLFNGINRGDFHDYRAAVHDSEGLSVHTGSGQWLWRPITNPERLEVSAFVDTTPRGFGLIQRKRLFLDYQDAEARYETRPSAWVEPIGDWRRGAVVLFEIPTRFEGNDNVVAYWQPEAGVRQGEPFSLTYRIHWDGEAASGTEGPRVAATRRGRNLTDTKEKFVIDFDMRGRKRAGEVTVEASRGKIESITQYPTPEDNILRVSFELDTDANESIELRLNLIPAEGPMGEHWLYRWTA